MRLRGKPERPTDNREVDLNMEEIVREKVSSVNERPLIKSPIEPKSEKAELEEIIRPLEEIVKTGEVLDDNKLIKEIDKVLPTDIADVVSTQIDIIQSPPKPVDAVLEDFSESEKARLLLEEDKRRAVSDQRRLDFENAFLEEQQRRVAFDEKIRIMKAEFELFLKNTFPEFVGDRNMTDDSKEKIQSDIKSKKEQNKAIEIDLQKKKLERLEREKERKLVERNLTLNKLTEGEVQTFFEEEIIIEQKQKVAQTPELEQLNPVQRQIKEMNEMEIRMGRPIVPHRDIVESEESDFDRNSVTKSDDILIKPSDRTRNFEQMQKEIRMEQLRNDLNSNKRGEEDYVSTLR